MGLISFFVSFAVFIPPCEGVLPCYSIVHKIRLSKDDCSIFLNKKGKLICKSLFKKMDGFFIEDNKELSKEEKFFSNVVGYREIKKLLLKSIVAKEPVHILLTGPPSSSKTIFLLEMLEGLDDAYFIDAVGSSGAGITNHLFNDNTKYLLVDEIDKMKKTIRLLS